MLSLANQRLFNLTTAAALAAFVAGPSVNAQTVLISDSFNRVTGNSDNVNETFLTDWGMNDNALPDGGTVVQTYLTTPTRTSGGGVNQTVEDVDSALFLGDADEEGVIRFGAVGIDYDLSTDASVISGGGFSVDFNLRRSTGFTSFFIGYDPAELEATSSGAAFRPITNADFGAPHAYLFQTDGAGAGQVQVFENAMQLDPPGNINGAALNGAFPFSDVPIDVSINVDAPDGLDSGDTITVSLMIDDISIPDATHTVTLADDDFAGFIGWTTNSGLAVIDDLVVTGFGSVADSLVGDYNSDGFVSQGDLDLVLLNWGDSAVPAGFNEDNLDGGGPFDGQVSQNELDGVLLNWGSGVAPSFDAVPEPTSLALLGVGAAAMLRRRQA